jgi:putative chitinase
MTPNLLACYRGIDTPLRQAHFMAQIAHESGGFKRLTENLNYSADGLRRTWPGRFTPSQAQHYARKPEAIANRV